MSLTSKPQFPLKNQPQFHLNQDQDQDTLDQGRLLQDVLFLTVGEPF